MEQCWSGLQATQPTLNRHAVNWAQRITQGGNLAAKLAEFCQDRLE
jgi:hypothetical protein